MRKHSCVALALPPARANINVFTHLCMARQLACGVAFVVLVHSIRRTGGRPCWICVYTSITKGNDTNTPSMHMHILRRLSTRVPGNRQMLRRTLYTPVADAYRRSRPTCKMQFAWLHLVWRRWQKVATKTRCYFTVLLWVWSTSRHLMRINENYVLRQFCNSENIRKYINVESVFALKHSNRLTQHKWKTPAYPYLVVQIQPLIVQLTVESHVTPEDSRQTQTGRFGQRRRCHHWSCLLPWRNRSRRENSHTQIAQYAKICSRIHTEDETRQMFE